MNFEVESGVCDFGLVGKAECEGKATLFPFCLTLTSHCSPNILPK